MLTRFLAVAVLGFIAGPAASQGYQVRTWGSYDRYPYPPLAGGTYSYSAYPPTVTLVDPWGRAYDTPLRPKVLYYDTPFLTPQGWHRPTSVVVMPDSRLRPPVARPYVPAPPARQIEPPTFRYDGGPADPVPDVTADPPRIPKDLPAVPEVPRLPDVPAAPGAVKVPKLGPAPRD